MEKQPHQEYRDNLADKLRGIRNNPNSENPKEEAKTHLEKEKSTIEYTNASSSHDDDKIERWIENIELPNLSFEFGPQLGSCLCGQVGEKLENLNNSIPQDEEKWRVPTRDEISEIFSPVWQMQGNEERAERISSGTLDTTSDWMELTATDLDLLRERIIKKYANKINFDTWYWSSDTLKQKDCTRFDSRKVTGGPGPSGPWGSIMSDSGPRKGEEKPIYVYKYEGHKYTTEELESGEYVFAFRLTKGGDFEKTLVHKDDKEDAKELIVVR